MAGSIVGTTVIHRRRGLVKLDALLTCDASGVVTAVVAGGAFGRLVSIGLPNGALDMGNAIITVRDSDTGAALFTLDTDQFKFGSTTTGDTTGGVSEDLFTTGAVHGLAVGDVIHVFAVTGGTGVVAGTDYYIKTVGTTTTFQLSATSGGAVLEIGATDISAMSWVKRAPRRFRPTAVVTSNLGVAVTAAATAPNVNRDVYVAGRVTIGVTEGGNLGAGHVLLTVDERPGASPR